METNSSAPQRRVTRRSPSWPSVIVCGGAGGIANFLLNSQLIAFTIFIGGLICWALLAKPVAAAVGRLRR